ncbi:MAG: hypothetical protein QNJ37_02560 [Crocosphaera sp.]|nr:hypothetical protein [Crocosphaera sp.]
MVKSRQISSVRWDSNQTSLTRINGSVEPSMVQLDELREDIAPKLINNSFECIKVPFYQLIYEIS